MSGVGGFVLGGGFGLFTAAVCSFFYRQLFVPSGY